MSSLSNCIKMAIILKSIGITKIEILAKELNVSTRQIQTYKKQLDEAGIWINSKPGKYGGYELIGNPLINLNLSEKDLIILDTINEQLKHDNNIYQSEFSNIINIVRSSINQLNHDKNIMEYFTLQPKCNSDNNKQKRTCEAIIYSYITKKKLEIKYHSLSSGLSKRIVHPYAITSYKGDFYMVAFCEKRQKVLDFKICRIEEYNTLEENYSIDENFSSENYIKNCIGIYKGNEIKVVLEIRNDFRYIIKEKIWVDNQKITDFDDYILFEANMRGYNEIKSWILSMGSNVKVIEPENLKMDIIEDLKLSLASYSK